MQTFGRWLMVAVISSGCQSFAVGPAEEAVAAVQANASSTGVVARPVVEPRGGTLEAATVQVDAGAPVCCLAIDKSTQGASHPLLVLECAATYSYFDITGETPAAGESCTTYSVTGHAPIDSCAYPRCANSQ